MNVAFFGTSDKSLPILTALKNCFDLKLCITKHDTLVGRDQEVRETEVKKWSQKNFVDYICINTMKNDSPKIVDRLKKHRIDLGIVADFNYIIPENIINATKYGLINIHFSLLPKLRGASPVQHCILNGLKETGVTYYLLDKGMDTGDILSQIKMSLFGTETTKDLYEKMFDLAANKLPDVVTGYIDGSVAPIKQDNTLATYCYSKTNPTSTLIQKEDARIDWQENVINIERQIRAYFPWPISWTTLGDLEKNEKLSEKIVLKDNINKDLRVKVYSGKLLNGRLKINQLQIEGKNIIDWDSFKRGYTI